MKMNRKMKRRLASMSDDYLRKLAVESVNAEIDKSAENKFDQQLAMATKYVLSAVVLAINKTHRWSQTGYDKMLNAFAERYAEIIHSENPEEIISMAEDICGREMTFVFTHDEFDYTQIGAPVEMYVNGTWRKGTLCEGLPDMVTMQTKDGQKFWCEIDSGQYRKPILDE